MDWNPPREGPELLTYLQHGAGELNERLGVRFLSASREELVATMPV